MSIIFIMYLVPYSVVINKTVISARTSHTGYVTRIHHFINVFISEMYLLSDVVANTLFFGSSNKCFFALIILVALIIREIAFG